MTGLLCTSNCIFNCDGVKFFIVNISIANKVDENAVN